MSDSYPHPLMLVARETRAGLHLMVGVRVLLDKALRSGSAFLPSASG